MSLTGPEETAASKETPSTSVSLPVAGPTPSEYEQALPVDEALDFSGLTKREALFCDAYIDSLNASHACRVAGYADDNSGWVMLRRPHIQEAIRLRRLRCQQVIQVIPSDCVKELVATGFSDIGNYCQWNEQGEITFTNSANLSRAERAAIKKVRSKTVIRTGKDVTETTTTMEIELHDKLGAISKLGEFMPALKDRVGHDLFGREDEEAAKDLRNWPDDLLEQVTSLIKERTARVVEVG